MMFENQNLFKTHLHNYITLLLEIFDIVFAFFSRVTSNKEVNYNTKKYMFKIMRIHNQTELVS